MNGTMSDFQSNKNRNILPCYPKCGGGIFKGGRNRRAGALADVNGSFPPFWPCRKEAPRGFPAACGRRPCLHGAVHFVTSLPHSVPYSFKVRWEDSSQNDSGKAACYCVHGALLFTASLTHSVSLHFQSTMGRSFGFTLLHSGWP